MSKTKSFDAVLGITKKVIKKSAEIRGSEEKIGCDNETATASSISDKEPTLEMEPVKASSSLADEPSPLEVDPLQGAEKKALKDERQMFERVHEEEQVPNVADRALIDQMRDEIQFLRTQLEIKDSQIEKKDHQLASKDDLLKNFQVLLKSEQDRVLRLETELTQESCRLDMQTTADSAEEVSWFKKMFQKS